MWPLDTIKSINRKKRKPAEDPFSRRCSFHRANVGIILHSAKRRSTATITDADDIRDFHNKAKKLRGNADKLDALIESYF